MCVCVFHFVDKQVQRNEDNGDEEEEKEYCSSVNIQKTGVTTRTKTRSLLNDMKTNEKSTSKISDRMMLEKQKIVQKNWFLLLLLFFLPRISLHLTDKLR